METLETLKLSEPTDGYQDWGPAFSPDGKLLAFVGVNGNLSAGEIYVMSASDGSTRRLTFDDGLILGPPVWTRDGKSIVFSSTRSALATIRRIPASRAVPPEPRTNGHLSGAWV